MKKISIIIPVYNIEKYIEKCIKSVICQNYENLEIILVNDGSTDNSLEICKKYEKKDKRIKIISQENQGLSMARNNAIKIATGDYIWFIDGDDYIEENSFEIIKKYIEDDYDIIISNYYRVINDEKKLVEINGKEYPDDVKYFLNFCGVWNKIIKKIFLNEDFFPKGKYYEDLYAQPSLVLKLKKYKYIDECLYNYVKRDGSITNNDNTNLINRFNDYYSGLNNIYNKLYKKYPEEVEFVFIRNFLFIFIIEEVKTKKNHNIKYINNLVKERFPKYYKNKYYNKKPLKKIFIILVYCEVYWLAKIIVYFRLKNGGNLIMKKISIIIPIYNIEKYIEKCIKSIICQNYENLEIILVNDGSTDNSLEICKKYEKKDKRIKIISQENQGVSVARNNALKIAKGDYIWFIDGDDYIEENSFEIIKKYIEEDYDIIISNYYRVINDEKKKVKIGGEEYPDDIRYLLNFCGFWNKIMKKKFLNDDIFPKGQYYEDFYAQPPLVLKLKKYKYIDECLYNYVKRDGSITNNEETNLINRFNDYYSGLNNMYNKLYKKYPEEVEFAFIRNFLFFYIIEEVKTKKNHNIKYINSLVKERFPKYYKNKYYNKKTLKRIFITLVYNEIYCLAKLITWMKLKVSNL